jgi:hypothetical protein
MKKKILALIMCIAMVIGIFPVYAFADDTSSDWTYNVFRDGTAEITGYYGTDTELLFPEIIDGYTMVAIADDAFKYDFGDECNFTKVVIPETYKRIGRNNFYECRSLSEVCLPSGLVDIGINSFVNTELYFNNRSECRRKGQFVVFYIGDYCICSDQGQNYSDYYSIKPGTKLIANSAFAHNDKLPGVIIPDGVEYINPYAFYDCYWFCYAVIPDTVKSIGKSAFGNNGLLDAVIIPEGVTEIDDKAFYKSEQFLTIYGVKGSAAEEFATQRGIEFVEMKDITYGDIDGDGVVTISDYASTESYSIGNTEISGNAHIVGDMNHDQIIDAFDAAAIDRVIAA